jgi:HEAT repeat protein
LGEIGHANGILPLVQALKTDTSPSVRSAAGLALRTIGDRESNRAVAEALATDPSDQMRLAFLDALREGN